jgi:hypothetical protein
MTRTRNMLAVFFALTILGLPAWAGSIGLQLGTSGKVGNRGLHPVSGFVRVTDMTFGTQTLSEMGWFSFTTGKLSGQKPNELLFGAGGKFKSVGCVDVDLDGGKCDKKDFRGTLFTGTFKSAELFQASKNTFTLNGQIWVTLSPALATQFGISSATPYLADIHLKFVGAVLSGKLSSTGILGGSVTPTVPEPTALVLLGFGAVIGTFIHTTLRVRCAGI